tara:strand:- start:41 stop:442 length:402 start_codon:yes stop_codon:yes gene_type:complete
MASFNKAEYNKEYRQKNKKRLAEKRKEYYELNKEKNKEYEQNNKEKIAKRMGEYRQTEKCKKSHRISKWKSRGVISNNYDELYDKFINTTNCENCDIEFIEGDLSINCRCLDHDHLTGQFRNVLCIGCNIKRG